MCVHAALKNAKQQQVWKVLESTMLKKKSSKKFKKHLKGPLGPVYFTVISQFKNVYILSCQNVYQDRSHKTLFHTYYCYLSHGHGHMEQTANQSHVNCCVLSHLHY